MPAVRRALLGLALVAGLSGCGGGEATPATEEAASAGSAESSAPVSPADPTAAPTEPSPAPPEESATAAGDQAALAELAEQAASAAESVAAGSGSAGSGSAGTAGEPVLGADMSWPQCPKGMGIPQKQSLGAPLPLDTARYVVVGLTNGPGFYANPCLADQVDFVRSRGLLGAAYSVVSYPDAATLAAYGSQGPYDAKTPAGVLSNVGYQQALFNMASMRATDLRTPIVWLDVEHVPDFDWSSDPAANAAVVVGAARGYTDAGYRVGVYSTPYIWSQLVGDLALGVPEWRAAGQTSRAEALSRCGDDWVIQGGPSVLGQWVEAGRDQNVTCPGAETRLGEFFHQY